MTSTGTAVLRTTLGRQRRHLAAASALHTGHQGGEALVPVLVGVVIDRGVATGDVGGLLLWLGVLAATFVTLSLSWRFGARQSLLAAVGAERELRMRLAGRILAPRGGAEAGHLPGGLVSIATGDVRRVADAAFMVPVGIAAVAGVAVAGTALLTMSVPLGLLVLLGTPPLLFVAQLLSRPVERRSAAQQEEAARASGVAADLVRGVRVLKGIGAEEYALERYRRVSRGSLRATLATARAQGGYEGTVLSINGLFLALVALVGGGLAVGGSISVGELVSAVGLAQFLTGPVQVVGDLAAVFAIGRASAARIVDVLGAPYSIGSGEGSLPNPVRGELRLDGVSAVADATAGIHLVAEPGSIVAVVADPPTATALLAWLGRERDPGGGRVLLDGVAFDEIDPHELRGTVLVSTHDADLFTGSLHDNLTAVAVGDPAGAIAAAAADQVAAALPAGHDTAVAERGSSLSGGQRQRVALARALAAHAPVLVLHDPTTAVDTVTEARIADGLRTLRAQHTTLLLTTSPALLAVADSVVVLRDGAVAATGTHAELLRGDADYRATVLS
ncbi:ABC transporter transmembrane domain-containing protein [Pseudonocardia abyssalis]|uniref:ABC transporter ATP-binding protein n=1 Tax=Pseudonocardia abyssalis TaxID=2792008 RepID=A0ABS6UNY0_9PSEU|nr:ABC transporter ATP-binding protein [Pseudonocardia abyssalis]MBW0114798.1 ABC transporter ATP-binding protein [Pseudonocardia abyssalis]MBW0133958.1 ABC transporter ATP-binding protein [Pseudonocardia abyssalis]